LIVLLAVVPTIIYAFSLQHLSAAGGIDVGATTGSYIGLFLLGAVFTSVGLCTSSFTNNTVIAFISGAFVCLLLYTGFDALSQLPLFSNGLDYYVQMLGINFHYKSISKGVIDIRDMIYFFAVIILFISVTKGNLDRK
jgi:ABC-2 type transport system permease protein